MIPLLFGCIGAYVGVDQGCLQVQPRPSIEASISSQPGVSFDDTVLESLKRITLSARDLTESVKVYETMTRDVAPMLTTLKESLSAANLGEALCVLDTIACRLGPAANSFIAEVIFELPILFAAHPNKLLVAEQGILTRPVSIALFTQNQHRAYQALVADLHAMRDRLGPLPSFVYPHLFDLVVLVTAKRFDLVQRKISESKSADSGDLWKGVELSCRNFSIFQDAYFELKGLCPALFNIEVSYPLDLAISISRETTMCLQTLSTSKAEMLIEGVRKALSRISHVFGNIMASHVGSRSDVDMWLFLCGRRFSRMPSNEELNRIFCHTPKELRQLARLSVWKFPVLVMYEWEASTLMNIAAVEESWTSLTGQFSVGYEQHRIRIGAVKRRFQLT